MGDGPALVVVEEVAIGDRMVASWKRKPKVIAPKRSEEPNGGRTRLSNGSTLAAKPE